MDSNNSRLVGFVRAFHIVLWSAIGVASGFSQGTLLFSNYATSVKTHVYLGGDHQISGNGANDYPVGTQDWSGFTPLSGTGYTAQLWFSPGADQPEGSLQPVLPTTTFLTVAAGAGILQNGGTIILAGAQENTVATISLRVWDNQGGTISTWAMAQAAGVTLGESPLYNSPPLGAPPGDGALPLIGLVSFNIYQVPEPSVLALVGLGALALWACRRRG